MALLSFCDSIANMAVQLKAFVRVQLSVCVRVCICVGEQACVCTGRPRVEVDVFLNHLSLFFEAEPLTEPGVHWFD